MLIKGPRTNFSCSRWSDHKLHPTLEKSLHNESKKTNICILYVYVSGRGGGYLLVSFLASKYTRSRSENICVGKPFFPPHLDLRISNGFSNLPEIWVQRWKHGVLAGMPRLQVGLSGWASLESRADLSEVHPACSLQRGQSWSWWGGWWRISEDKPSPSVALLSCSFELLLSCYCFSCCNETTTTWC